MLNKTLILTLALLAIATVATNSRADDTIAELRFDQHQFKPLKLDVPAGQPVTIKVD